MHTEMETTVTQSSGRLTDRVDNKSATSSQCHAQKRLHGSIDNRPASACTQYLASDRFLNQSFIANGGMSIVVRALDTKLSREVALKLRQPQSDCDQPEAAHISEEARTMACLDHPRIPPVFDFGADDRGVHFIAMKLIDGETLDSAVKRAGVKCIDPEFLITFMGIFTDVCAAVTLAHRCGIIHRDLKPANIMIDRRGETYVIDWGVALRMRPRSAQSQDFTMNMEDVLVGTLCYMAPEQLACRQDQVDERVDVYSLGATLCQILTGQPPTRSTRLAPGRSGGSICPERILRGGPIATSLWEVATKAMSRDPSERYQSVAELADAVQGRMQAHDVLGGPPQPGRCPVRFDRPRHRPFSVRIARDRAWTVLCKTSSTCSRRRNRTPSPADAANDRRHHDVIG